MPSGPRFISSLLLFALCGGLVACASGKKTTASSGERRMQDRLLRPDLKKTNPWEKEFRAATDRGATKALSSKSYGAGSYSGVKAFHTGDYKTKEFAQSGKTSTFGNKQSDYAKRDNRMGSKAYATKDSRFSGKPATEDAKTYRDGSRDYKTKDYAPGSKSIDDNKRILMDNSPATADRSANAYSESEVKRLLGK